MVNSNSIATNSTAINNTVTSVITSSLQSVNNSFMYDQSVSLNCNDFSKAMLASSTKCMNDLQTLPPDQVKILCDYGLSCSAGGINMQQNVNVDTVSEQQNVLKTKVSNDLKNELTSDIQQSSGLQIMPDNVKQDITTLVSTTVSILNDNLQSIVKELQSVQKIVNGGGVTINFVTMKQTQSVISNTLQMNSAYTEIVNKIQTDITEAIKQEGEGMNFVWSVVYGVLIFFALVALIILLLRAIHKKRK